MSPFASKVPLSWVLGVEFHILNAVLVPEVIRCYTFRFAVEEAHQVGEVDLDDAIVGAYPKLFMLVFNNAPGVGDLCRHFGQEEHFAGVRVVAQHSFSGCAYQQVMRTLNQVQCPEIRIAGKS